jgi:hypothetical protein
MTRTARTSTVRTSAARLTLASLAVFLIVITPSTQSAAALPGQRDNTGKDAVMETLVGLEKASWQAWQKRDGTYFDKFLSDDHVEVGVGGPGGKAAIVSFVGSPSCVVKNYVVDRFALTMFDANTALLTYHAQQDTTCNGVAVPSPAWASSLFVKRNGRWQNALYQQTPTPK